LTSLRNSYAKSDKTLSMFKKISLVLPFILLGCQTYRPIVDGAGLCSRSPANNESCTAVLAHNEKTIELKNVEAAFASLDQYWTPDTNSLDFSEPEDLKDHTRRYYLFSSFGLVLAKDLIEREKRGDQTAKILRKIGYKQKYGLLLPNKNLGLMYFNIYRLLIESARAAHIADSEINLPALKFISRTGKIKFVSPGIDPLPDSKNGWRLDLTNEELAPALYAKMIAEKKLILEPVVWFHDIGHIIDSIECPECTAAFRHYFEAKSKSKLPTYNVFRNDYGKWHDYIINETAYFPSPTKIEAITSVIPDFKLTSGSAQSLDQKYLDMPTAKLMALAKKFLAAQEILFPRHGGGARDFYYPRFKKDEELFADVVGFLRKGANRPTMFALERNFNWHFFREEAPGIFDRLDIILNRWNNEDLRKDLRLRYGAATEKDFKLLRHKLVAGHLAEIERKIVVALTLGMGPIQIANDLAALHRTGDVEAYKKSATYQYYSTYPEDSIMELLMLKPFSDPQ
jgi:hypothetical protein